MRNLPLVITLTIGAIAQGVALSKVGYPAPFLILGSAIGMVSCGLFYTLDTHTSTGKWIGYQILSGIIIGFTFQTTIAVVQVNAKPEDMSAATAMIFCEFDNSHNYYYEYSLSPCKTHNLKWSFENQPFSSPPSFSLFLRPFF